MDGPLPTGEPAHLKREIWTEEKVVEVLPNGRFSREVRVERVRVEASVEGREPLRVFDTDAPPPEGEAAATTFARRTEPLRKFRGATVTLHERPTGLIESFGGLEDLKARLTGDLAADAPERRTLEGLATPLYAQAMFGPELLVPPGRASVGEATKMSDVQMLPETSGTPGLSYYRGEYRLVEAKDGRARVEVQGEVSLDPFPGAPPWPAHLQAYRAAVRLDRGTFRGWARLALGGGGPEETEHVTELDLVHVGKDGAEVPMPTRILRARKILR